jgi:hypothetical protein
MEGGDREVEEERWKTSKFVGALQRCPPGSGQMAGIINTW